MMRLFFALELDKNTRDHLIKLMNRLRLSIQRGKWTRPENLHLTLVFIGDCDVQRVPDLREIAKAAAEPFSPFCLQLKNWGTFGKTSDILWVGISENVTLINLVADLRYLLRQAGFFVDERSYRPHITLARMTRLAEPITKIKPDDFATCSMISELTLMESVREKSILTYRPCFRQPFLSDPDQ